MPDIIVFYIAAVCFALAVYAAAIAFMALVALGVYYLWVCFKEVKRGSFTDV